MGYGDACGLPLSNNMVEWYNARKPNPQAEETVSEKTEERIEAMTPELKAFVESWKSKPGNLIMVLHQVQQAYGYIPRNIAIEISEMLGVPLAKIYGVVTFYNFFKLQKAGKYIVQVCLGTACYLRGGDDIIKEFEKQLGVGLNATTSDGLFSVEAVRCLGCCGLAPVAVVNGEVHGKLETKDVTRIIDQYRKIG